MPENPQQWLMLAGVLCFLAFAIWLNVHRGPHGEWGHQERIQALLRQGTEPEIARLTVLFRDYKRNVKWLTEDERKECERLMLKYPDAVCKLEVLP